MQAAINPARRIVRRLRLAPSSRLIVLLALLVPLLGPRVPTAHAAVVNLTVTGVAIQVQEGVPFITTVATFPDPGAGPYTALVDWGDGVTNNGGFSTGCAGSVCTTNVNAQHVYQKVGT